MPPCIPAEQKKSPCVSVFPETQGFYPSWAGSTDKKETAFSATWCIFDR